MKNRRTYKKAGAFVLSQSEMIVTDPSYDKNPRNIIKNAIPGKWHCFVNRNKYRYNINGETNEDCRIAALFAVHETQSKEIFSTIRMQEVQDAVHVTWSGNWSQIVVSVDSGQAGIFDAAKYGKEELFRTKGRCGFGNKWYSNCCDATLGATGVGIVANCGVNASAGFGDGWYPVYTHTNSDNKVDAIVIFFLADDEKVEWD